MASSLRERYVMRAVGTVSAVCGEYGGEESEWEAGRG